MARRPLRHVSFVAGVAITSLLVVVAAVGLVWTPADPLGMSIGDRLEAPSHGHPFGTDEYGRDVFSRVLAGAFTSLAVGVIAVALGMGIGVALGALSGYVGGFVDEALMRLMDAVMGFPAILSALLLGAVLGPGVAISMVAIGIAFVPTFARLTRASFLALRERDFVVATRALGAADSRLVVRHILPNIIQPVIVQAAIGMAGAILAEATLSFLGLGVPPPTPSWGAMLNDGRSHLFDAPHLVVFPALAVMFAVLAFNFLGDGLRDYLDPHSRPENQY